MRLCSKTNYYFEAHLIAWDNDFLRHDNMHTDVRRYHRKVTFDIILTQLAYIDLQKI